MNSPEQKLALLAEQVGISQRELSNALFWLRANVEGGERRPDFRSGPEVVHMLLMAGEIAADV
jgi:hypothetical protein